MMNMKEVWNSIHPYLEDGIDDNAYGYKMIFKNRDPRKN